MPPISLKNPRLRRALWLLFCTSLLATGSLSLAADGLQIPYPLVEEWKGQMSDAVTRSNYALSSRFYSLIWDNVADINLESGHIGIFTHGVEVQRRVFDNHDLGNSYTVIDHFKIPTSLDLFSRNLAETGAAGHFMAALGISLGTQQGLEFLDIRQVHSSKALNLANAEELRARAADKASWFISLQGDEEQQRMHAPELPAAADKAPSPPEDSDSEAKDSLSILDPLLQARYGSFWRRFSFPAFLPLTVEKFLALEDGEVLSYNVNGAVQLGAHVGWTLPLHSVFSHLGGRLSYSAYLRGDYRIAVLKEDSRFARVKVTRMKTSGRRRGMNSKTEQKETVGGFIASGADAIRSRFFIVPFHIELDSSNADAFDVGYRYDLSDGRARKAYELAALGRFAYSDQLASETRSASEEAPVSKLYSRAQKISTEVFNAGVRVASFYRHQKTSSVTDWDAVVTLPDGKRHILTTDTLNREDWKPFWGFGESVHHSFRISLDLDAFGEGRRDALYLVAEGTYEDRATDGLSLREYQSAVEEAVGETGIFPKLPVLSATNQERPPSDSEQVPDPSPRTAEYGYSTFYYRIVLNQAQIETFLGYPAERMWPALERAFGVEPGSWSTDGARVLARIQSTPAVLANIPLFAFHLRFNDAPKLGHAQEVHKLWSALSGEASPAERIRKLARLFGDTTYSRELVRLLRVVLEGQEIPYTASGTNVAIGHIWKQGAAKADFYPIADRINREIDFDTYNDSGSVDGGASISGISISPRQEGGYELRFASNVEPSALYVRLVEDGGWRINRVLAEFIVGGGGYLHAGTNSLVLSEAAGEPWATLARQIQPGKRYFLTLAVSRDGRRWGPLGAYTHYTPDLFNH